MWGWRKCALAQYRQVPATRFIASFAKLGFLRNPAKDASGSDRFVSFFRKSVHFSRVNLAESWTKIPLFAFA